MPSPPQDIEIRHEDTDMMNYRGLSNSLVKEEPNQVFAGVHGGHVDHDLGVWSMGRGVQQAHVPPGHCRQSKPASEGHLT